jgi:YHS domain-containing protein
MTKTLVSFTVCIICLGLLVTLVPAQEEPAPDGLVIEQVCNGFPGTKQKQKTRQKVIIKGDMIYMENHESPNLCIVRGDKKLIWEIDLQRKKYDERLFEYFDKLRGDKRASRDLTTKNLNAIRDKNKRIKMAEELGRIVDEEGNVLEDIVSKTENTGEEKEINGFKCYHVKIYEDAHPVLDLWLTKSLKAPKGLMDFYKKLGCFPEKVVEEMTKIEDFPILLKADLDFGSITVPVECEIKKVEEKKISPEQFNLSDGLTKRKIIGKVVKIIVPDKVICPVCRKEVDTKAEGKDKPIRYVRENVAYYFHSGKCYQRFLELMKKHKDFKKVMKILAEEAARKK